ncbi:MAG TPA: BON domain-containing protein [Pirellulales bacterium]|nr:BON domain-containing protein [Pirellulales bacterium]
MRRIALALALSLLAIGPPMQVRADDDADRQTAQEIAAMLRESGKIHNYNVGVVYKKGKVWLEGRVSDQQQMNEVLGLVGDLDEVTQIVNNLTVGAAQQQTQKRRPTIVRGEAQLASAQRPMNRGVPLGTSTGRGQAQPAGYQQGMMDEGGYCPPGQGGQMNGNMMPGAMGGQMINSQGGQMVPNQGMGGGGNRPLPAYTPGPNGSPPPAAYDQPYMPNYAWPSYAAYPNYAAVTYPKQYAASAWPYIGPFYPYPQVPLGWRKVSLEWDDGWWFLDFDDRSGH